MRILVVCHYFPPEVGAPQARLSEFARAWAAAGEHVTVLTGMPNHPTGVVPADYRRRIVVRETTDGYSVVRTWLYATANDGVVKKSIGHLSFMASSVLLGCSRVGPADVVIVSSPTFFSILGAWVLARWKGARFVVEVRDLWPAIFVELGILRSRPAIAALEALELSAYRAADAVVVVSHGFAESIAARGIPADKIHVIPNGADLERFRPNPANVDVRARLGAGPGDTLVLYLGAHGISHGLAAIADAAAELATEPVKFAFVGEGAAKAELSRRVAELELPHVMLMPAVPTESVAELISSADICLVPLRDLQLFQAFIPSKLFEYLAAGKAVVGSVAGEAAEILKAAGALVVDPEDSAAIAGAIGDLSRDPNRRRAMGSRGRAFVEQHFDRQALARRYRALLLDLLDAS